ncbi:MAG: hypothetical protein LC689_19545 [Myxococcales bacterium]|nr:hypothetical protein [Myxococcales bacterium]
MLLALVLACGIERWLIKTASDANAASISTRPAAGTIALLTSYPAQNGNDFDRIQPTELTVYQLSDVSLLQYRLETDGDYHLVLSDGTRTMIVEIPDPGCVASTSPLSGAIANARAQFDAKHGPVQPTPTTTGETVTVTGVAFFDDFHSQTGVAQNAIELHPVLSICFGAGCAPPPTGTAPPAPASHTGCTSANLAFLLPLLVRRRRA